MPTDARSGRWEVRLDTTQPRLPDAGRTIEAGTPFDLAARSLMLLRRIESGAAAPAYPRAFDKQPWRNYLRRPFNPSGEVHMFICNHAPQRGA